MIIEKEMVKPIKLRHKGKGVSHSLGQSASGKQPKLWPKLWLTPGPVGSASSWKTETTHELCVLNHANIIGRTPSENPNGVP